MLIFIPVKKNIQVFRMIKETPRNLHSPSLKRTIPGSKYKKTQPV